jgi:hypothetical protein
MTGRRRVMTERRIEEEVHGNGQRRVVVEEHEAHGEIEAVDREVAGEQEEFVTHADSWTVARGWLRTLAAFIAVGFAVIETLLLFRFGFLLAGANAANGFVDFIYDITGPLVEPFDNIVAQESFDGGVFEPASVIAMVVYAALAFLLNLLLWAAAAAPSSHGPQTTSVRSRHRSRAIHGE